MELAVANEDLNLAAFRSQIPLSISTGKPAPGEFDGPGCYRCYRDGNSVESCGSDGIVGYETLDAPPHYDFYANTVWGRQRRFRPSLFQLHADPEVRNPLAVGLQVCKYFFRVY